MRLLIILALIYLGWQLFKKYVFPFMVVVAANKVKDRVMKDMNQNNSKNDTSSTSQTSDKKEVVGEYIEFEEIEIKNEA